MTKAGYLEHTVRHKPRYHFSSALKPKPQRLGKRERLTLIAALRCNTYRGIIGTLDVPAVVICSDGQETAGDFRVEVQKIRPIDAGSYELIIGGSGNIGPLIDGQSDAIERNVKIWPAGLSEPEARARLENVLRSYNARHVKDYPIADDKYPEYKLMAFLICVRDKTSRQIYLWRTDATTIQTVGDYALVGWQEAAYYHHLKWLHMPGLTRFRAALIGLQLLRSAQDNLYIGPPFHVVEVDVDGMRMWPPEKVQLLGERAGRFNAVIARLLLTFPRLERSEDEFEKFLEQLEGAIAGFRREQIDSIGDMQESYGVGVRWEYEQEAREREERSRAEQAAKQSKPSDSDRGEE